MNGEIRDVARAHRELLSYLRACFPNVSPEVREDAAQEAWCAHAKHRYRLDDEPIGWLNVVARHEVLRLLRKQRTDSLEVLAESGWEPSARDDRDARAASAEFLTAVRHLGPLRQRAVIGRVLGLSYDELATATGSTYTNVNRHVTEGRAELRALLST